MKRPLDGAGRSRRHLLGSIRVRPAAAVIAELLRAHPDGLPLAALWPLTGVSRRMTTASAEDAIAAGLVVRCGSGSRNFRYAAVEHAARVQALIAAASAASAAWVKSPDRMRVRRRGAAVARPYSAREEQPDLPVRRVIVPAAECEPLAPHVRGPASVWHMGQGT